MWDLRFITNIIKFRSILHQERKKEGGRTPCWLISAIDFALMIRAAQRRWSHHRIHFDCCKRCQVCAFYPISFRWRLFSISIYICRELGMNCSVWGVKLCVLLTGWWVQQMDKHKPAWKLFRATLRWCVRVSSVRLHTEAERGLSLHTAHSECSMCFDLTFHFALALFSAALYELFSNMTISACQHWRTNRLQLHTHTHTHAPVLHCSRPLKARRARKGI